MSSSKEEELAPTMPNLGGFARGLTTEQIKIIREQEAEDKLKIEKSTLYLKKLRTSQSESRP